jgi:hypothetical protein
VVCFDQIRFRFPAKEKFQSAARWPDSTIDFAAQSLTGGSVKTTIRLLRCHISFARWQRAETILGRTLAVFEQRLATIKARPVGPVAA